MFIQDVHSLTSLYIGSIAPNTFHLMCFWPEHTFNKWFNISISPDQSQDGFHLFPIILRYIFRDQYFANRPITSLKLPLFDVMSIIRFSYPSLTCVQSLDLPWYSLRAHATCGLLHLASYIIGILGGLFL